MSKFGEVTIPATGSVTVASGYLGAIKIHLRAHPSNSGILYVKNTGDAGNGFPLGAGDFVDAGGGNVGSITASGVVGGRLAYAIEQ